jgi:hypothetical protein
MKVKNVSYPYPVLGNEDDVEGAFNINFSHIQGNDKINLIVKIQLKNPTLEKAIEHKKACFFLEIECNSTFYRTSYKSYEYKNIFELDAKKVRDRVTVKFFIRAMENLPNYSIFGCNPDYTGLTFDISKGDVLAVGGVSSFIAEKGFDPLRPIVASFVVVKEGHHDDGEIIPDFSNSNRIIIKLSKKDWSRYRILKGRTWMSPIIHACIVFPVLAEAIRRINLDDPDIEETRWCGRLKTILEQKQLPLDDPFHSAQKILQYPLDRSLTQIESQDLSESDS